jgi:hypothetical protein
MQRMAASESLFRQHSLSIISERWPGEFGYLLYAAAKAL